MPAQLIPLCGLRLIDVCPDYPNEDLTPDNNTVNFVYQCLYTNPSYPGTYNYYSGIMASCSYQKPTNNLNLSIPQNGTASSANPSQVTANDKISVKPNVPTTIYAKVSGSGFNSPENRTATVSLNIGDTTLSSSVAVSSIQAAGTLLVPFSYTFSTDEAGELDLSVSVSTSDDSSASDNSYSDKMYVLCSVEDSGRVVPFYPQVGRAWSDDPYGIIANSSNPGTIHKYGCSIADFAMLINSYGINRTPLGSPLNPAVNGTSNIPGLNAEIIDPGTLNLAFANYKTPLTGKASVALNNANDPDWKGMAEVARAGYRAQCIKSGSCDPSNDSSSVSFKGIMLSGFNNDPNSSDNKKIYKQLCEGNPVIMKFSKASGNGQHYMLAKGTSVDASGKLVYRLSNPGSSAPGQDNILHSQLVNIYPKILGYTLYHPSADPSMMTITAPPNAHIVVTDPMGRRTGYDPITDTTYAEIPGASYGLQSINTPGEPEFADETLVAENYFLSSQDVPPGDYHVEVFSMNGGSYYLDYRATDSAGYLNEASYKSGTLSAGQTATVTYTHSIEPAVYANASLKISNYVLNQKKKGFLDIGVILGGRIIPNDGSKIKLTDQFSLKIGGDSGLTLTLRANQFKTLKILKSKTYIYIGRDVKVILHESGIFELIIDKARTSMISKDEAEKISIEVDLVKAETTVPLRGSKNVCTKAGK